MEQPRTRRRAARLRRAEEALLDSSAQSLLDRLQEVICEANRSQIVRALATTPLTVTDLSRVIRRSKSTTSRHLRVLREVGIVVGQRRGREVTYNLAAGPVVQIAVGTLNLLAAAAGAR